MNVCVNKMQIHDRCNNKSYRFYYNHHSSPCRRHCAWNVNNIEIEHLDPFKELIKVLYKKWEGYVIVRYKAKWYGEFWKRNIKFVGSVSNCE